MSIYNFVKSLEYIKEQAIKRTDSLKKEYEYQVDKTQESYSDLSSSELKAIAMDEKRSNIERNAAYRQHKENKSLQQPQNKYKIALMQGAKTENNKRDIDHDQNITKETLIKQTTGKKRPTTKPDKKDDDIVLTIEDLENFDIVDDIWDIPETENDYRKTALFFTDSNHGWIVCPKCGKHFRAKQMDADHIYPKSKGGDNSQYNLQMLCAHCNRSKQDDTSETEADLVRRREELNKMKKEDYEFAKIIDEMIRNGEI